MDIPRGTDLRGAVVVEADLRGARLIGCVVDGLRVDSFAGDLGSVVVDDVEVGGFVRDTLDARHPERRQLRAVRTADDHRAMWTTVERLWTGTLASAEALPDAVRTARVDGEWSLTDTVRHLVFAVDVWLGRVLADEPRPVHPLGLPTGDTSPRTVRDLGLDPAATPSWAEVVAVHAGRLADVRAALAELTDDRLDDVRTVAPIPEWGTESHTVQACFRVLAAEHVEHRRYAVRDLARLPGPGGAPAATPD